MGATAWNRSADNRQSLKEDISPLVGIAARLRAPADSALRSVDSLRPLGGSYASNRGCDRLIQGREIDAFIRVVGGTGTDGVR